jgi:hypothetical protein
MCFQQTTRLTPPGGVADTATYGLAAMAIRLLLADYSYLVREGCQPAPRRQPRDRGCGDR